MVEGTKNLHSEDYLLNRVPVVSKEGKPLMPTKPSKARKLVQDGLAIGKWDKLSQYYISVGVAGIQQREYRFQIVIGND